MTTRKEAIAAGAKTYRPHRPCANGHSALRYTRSGACLQCLADARDARHRTETGQGPTTLTLSCHPDDAPLLLALHAHLAATRKLTSP